MMANAPNMPKLNARLSPMDCIIVAVTTDISKRDCIKLNDRPAGDVVLSYVKTSKSDSRIVSTVVSSIIYIECSL